MTITVTGTALKRGSFVVTEDPLFGLRTESVELKASTAYSHGTGPNQINAVASFSLTIPAATTATLDLMDVGQTAFQFGGRVAFTAVKELHAQNKETTAGRVALWGTAGANDATGYAARLDPGGSIHVSSPVSGFAVNNANRYLSIANPGGSPVTLDVLIAGIGTYADT
ncbi:MAG: hypothetical protein EBR86_16895 [Planctomycetia bacterium]|nr:hypothetical protein [Planctomycetia bacterium]